MQLIVMSSSGESADRIIVHRFCEYYFSAISTWLSYKDVAILVNRIQLLATIVKVLNKNDSSTFSFGIKSENDDAPLLAELISPDYKIGSDNAAYQRASKLVDKTVFMAAGIFFQNNFLKTQFQEADHEVRESIFKATEKFFRITENAGLSVLSVEEIDDNNIVINSGAIELEPLSGEALKLYHVLIRFMPES